MTGSFTKYQAPHGTVWLCAACGKMSDNRVKGVPGSGWDESCFLWAVLCTSASVTLEQGRVTGAQAVTNDEYEGGRPRREPA